MSEEQYEVGAVEIDGVWFIKPDQYYLMQSGEVHIPMVFIETAGIKELDAIFECDSQANVWWDAAIDELENTGVLLLYMHFHNREDTILCICFDDYEDQSELAHKVDHITFMVLARYNKRDNQIIVPLDKQNLLEALNEIP